MKTNQQVQKVNFGKVRHLTRDQLRQRSWGQFLVYAVGVITLGLVGSIVALIAYMTIVPIELLLGGKSIKGVVDESARHLYNFLKYIV